MAVLISMQIIEQSLDIDFDLMISELAPAIREDKLREYVQATRVVNLCFDEELRFGVSIFSEAAKK
jgi:hypothetical protein